MCSGLSGRWAQETGLEGRIETGKTRRQHRVHSQTSFLWVTRAQSCWESLGARVGHAAQNCPTRGARELRYLYNSYLTLIEGCSQDGVNFLVLLALHESGEGYHQGNWPSVLIGPSARLERTWSSSWLNVCVQFQHLVVLPKDKEMEVSIPECLPITGWGFSWRNSMVRPEYLHADGCVGVCSRKACTCDRYWCNTNSLCFTGDRD